MTENNNGILKNFPPGLGRMAKKIYGALEKHPDGLDIYQLREICAPEEVQDQFSRRLRALYPYFRIALIRGKGPRPLYKLLGSRPPGEWDSERISKTLAAEIRHKAHGRCQMCGKTIAEDQIRLHVDHKVPRSWGGRTISENLWAICSDCNEGKKNYFATFDKETMKRVLAEESVHWRILKVLRLKQGKWVDRDSLDFVANFEDFQEDWHKRLRELRYFGLKIEVHRKKAGKRVVSYYRLKNRVENLPADLSQAAGEYERERAKRRAR